MNEEDYRKQFTEDDTVGWNCIDRALDNMYGTTKPRHYGPLCGIHFAAGGSDPIDGISVYDNPRQAPHFHLVSYGMSELYYTPDKAGGEFSKWGFEFTFRLLPFADDEGDPGWAMHVFNNLARYVFNSGRWFEENQFIPANGPIRLKTNTDITGFVTTLDPQLGKIDTPHGEVSFIQLVGITQRELEQIRQNPTQEYIEQFIGEMKKENDLLITDLNRT